MEDASFLVYTFHIDTQQFFKDIKLLIEGQLLTTENPRTSKCGATYHNGIHTVGLKRLIGLVKTVYIAITNNRNMYLWITLHLADKSPVCLAGVHLTAGTTVDG